MSHHRAFLHCLLFFSLNKTNSWSLIIILLAQLSLNPGILSESAAATRSVDLVGYTLPYGQYVFSVIPVILPFYDSCSDAGSYIDEAQCWLGSIFAI